MAGAKQPPRAGARERRLADALVARLVGLLCLVSPCDLMFTDVFGDML